MPGRAAARRERQRERGRADQEGREMLAKQFRGFRFCRVEPMTSRSPVFAPIFSTHAHPRGDVTVHTHTRAARGRHVEGCAAAWCEPGLSQWFQGARPVANGDGEEELQGGGMFTRRRLVCRDFLLTCS